MTRRNPDELLNTERIFFDMIREYADGHLGNSQHYYRARVEMIDPVGGKIEAEPANPPRSIRARVYTSGLDAATPHQALPVFYPLLPNINVQTGEHVIVVFEDRQKTFGYWINVVPAFSTDGNYGNPDFRQRGRADSSYTFEQDQRVQSTINLGTEYGGSTVRTQGRQDMVDLAESNTLENKWSGKRVLLIGDSQVAGPFGVKLSEELRTNQSVAYLYRDGRVSWGVISWLNGRLTRESPTMPQLSELISQHTPNVVIISLGGNDGSSGRARRPDYSDKVRELLNQVPENVKIIWSGPPTAVGSATSRQPARIIAARKIEQVVGAEKFLDVFGITNTTNGRRADGVHFNSDSPALQPWAEAVVRRGTEIL